MSEKGVSEEKLAKIVWISAVWVLVVALVKEVVMSYLVGVVETRYGQAIAASVVLFGPPSFLLGMISPYAARLSIEKVSESGAEVGKLYAISTLGSIGGTFLTGFWLVPTLGHLRTLYLVVLSLVVASLVVSRQGWWMKLVLLGVGMWAMVQGWTVKLQAGVVVDQDTAYSRVQIKEKVSREGTMRGMFTDGAYSSGVILERPETLVFGYYNYYDLMFWRKRDVQKVLMIGGAGMGYPRYVEASFPKVAMTVVEIDPMLYQIAQEAMGYQPSKRVEMVYEDGRVFLGLNEEKYDAVLLDVFSAYTLPWHLATKETAELIWRALGDEGVVVMNIVSAIDGERAEILRSVAATYKAVFNEVEVFVVSGDRDREEVQNVVLVAAKQELDFEDNQLTEEGKSLLANRTTIDFDHRVLTDDWSPMDAYTARMMEK